MIKNYVTLHPIMGHAGLYLSIIAFLVTFHDKIVR
jgi:hypothetical protein